MEAATRCSRGMDGAMRRDTDSLRIKHIPLIAQDPPKCREFAIDHAPLEIIPWAEVLLAVATLNISCGLYSAFQDITLNRFRRTVWTGISLLVYDLDRSFLNAGPHIPVPVVPNLIKQQVLSFDDLSKTSRLLHPRVFKYDIGDD